MSLLIHTEYFNISQTFIYISRMVKVVIQEKPVLHEPFLTVTTLHIAAFWLLRTRAIGAPIFERVPPPPPPLLEQAGDMTCLHEEGK